MNNLPPEILNQIFALLHQKDRVKCMTVCHAWETTIENVSLFDTICISSVDQFIDLTSFVEQDQRLGLQTTRLIVDLSAFYSVQLQIFPTLFPNVRTFYLTGTSEVELIKKDSSFQLWRNHLEVLMEDQGSVFTWQFLGSGPCPRLKKLSFRRLLKRSQDFICILENTPNLQSLELTHISMTLQDFEALHATVPLLKKLDMASVTFKNSDFPSNIKPASSITSVSFGITNGIEKQSDILQYVAQKYNNLVDFSFNNKFNKLTAIDEFDIQAFDNAGFTFLFGQLNSTLKHLEITFTKVPAHFSRLLDDACCQIQSLIIESPFTTQMLIDLSLSNQAKSIQSLTLSKVDFEDFTFLKEFIQLKQLGLSSKHRRVRRIAIRETNLNTILDMCKNSLESLYLNGFKLSCHVDTDIYPLKHLTLESVVLPTKDKLDDFLSASCPCLRTLKLDGCELRDNRNGNFSLPNHHLKYLEVKDGFPTNEDYMLVKLGSNRYQGDRSDKNQRACNFIYRPRSDSINKYFPIHDNAVQGYDDPIPYLSSSTDNEPFITFECASVGTVILLYDN